jgi:hypothetical protein
MSVHLPWEIQIDDSVGSDSLAVIIVDDLNGEVTRTSEGQLYLTRIDASWEDVVDEGLVADYVARGKISEADQQLLEQRVKLAA